LGKAKIAPKSIKIVQWNIERGYELDKIIETLKKLDGDIICLQEIDILCERSKCVDVGVEIAKALKLNYYFISEFEELWSEIRDPRSQGGGVHGNGILTKFDVTEVRSLKHRYHPYNWELDGHLKKEPRKGERYTLAATIKTPFTPILCYTVHLEVSL
jgi:endonuclease/exonuclease/phosphatase family metal-dependent hydrolase